NCGSNQTFTITADACYHVADVLVDGVSVGAVTSYTLNNVTANHTIAAILAIDVETLTASAGAHGAISPAGPVAVDFGSDSTFTNVMASHTITASFAVDVETIAASAGDHGAISTAGSVSVDCGSSQTFAINPDACYQVADVLVDGASVGALTGYTFTGVTANH